MCSQQTHIFYSCPFTAVVPLGTFLVALHITCQTQLQVGFFFLRPPLHVGTVLTFFCLVYPPALLCCGEENWKETK